MGPPESAAELAAEVVELREPELQLTDPASPGEEHVDVEAEGAPGRGRCWPCRAWVYGSRGEPGECGRAGRDRSRPLCTGLSRDPESFRVFVTQNW